MGNVRITLATETGCHFQALYLDDRLIGDFGDNLSTNQDTSYEPVSDILERLFAQPEFDGFDFVQEWRYQKGFKTWTDYGWEYDAEWPASLSETALVPPEEYGFTEPPSDDLRTDGDN